MRSAVTPREQNFSMRWIFPTMPITSTSVPKPLATMITAMTMKPIWKLRVASDVSRSPKPTLVDVTNAQ
eukprot:scaffold7267_cov72-Phaeocystis_antarctica.AAC.3